MQTQTKWGAMYSQLEAGDVIIPCKTQLGDHMIAPGDKITRIGKKKRSMFEMQEGYYLVYQGICDGYLMFTSEPTGCSGDPWYYSFAYVDSTTLIIGGKRSYMDIKVDDLQLIG